MQDSGHGSLLPIFNQTSSQVMALFAYVKILLNHIRSWLTFQKSPAINRNFFGNRTTPLALQHRSCVTAIWASVQVPGYGSYPLDKCKDPGHGSYLLDHCKARVTALTFWARVGPGSRLLPSGQCRTRVMALIFWPVHAGSGSRLLSSGPEQDPGHSSYLLAL